MPNAGTVFGNSEHITGGGKVRNTALGFALGANYYTITTRKGRISSFTNSLLNTYYVPGTRTVTKSNNPDPLPRESHHLAGETKMQPGTYNTKHSGF